MVSGSLSQLEYRTIYEEAFALPSRFLQILSTEPPSSVEFSAAIRSVLLKSVPNPMLRLTPGYRKVAVT